MPGSAGTESQARAEISAAKEESQKTEEDLVEAGVSHRGVEVHIDDWSWQHAERPVPAVSGLNLHIARGERVLLAGASGAGKSTLLHGLAGVLGETGEASGQLLLDGTPPEEARGRAGLVQQDPESQVVLSRVGDDVAFAAENLAAPREEIWERVRRCLTATGLAGDVVASTLSVTAHDSTASDSPGLNRPARHGLGDHGPARHSPARHGTVSDSSGREDSALDHPTAHLSGGQKQRLALAGVLAMEPGLLLLDEPTANIDPEGIAQVREAVLSAAEVTGATVIVVEHRLGIWAEDMDTLVVLDAGGGVRHRVPAGELYRDQALREDLSSLGLWVPGYDPAESLRVSSGPGHRPDTTGSVVPHSEPVPLLHGKGLSVSRTPPSKSWRRRRPAVPVLEDLDITLACGEVVGITGPNGAGKSTLLLSLAGLLPVHAGEIQATERLKRAHTEGDDGEWTGGEQGGTEGDDGGLPDSPHSWRSSELVARIGTVFQEPEHQFARPTVREELALRAGRARLPGSKRALFSDAEIEDRVNKMLARLRLEHLAEANPFTLSGGEKRRLSVGTVLVAGPPVLMLDEPTFGQDAHTFLELVTLLREHCEQGGSVLAVTHDDAFIRALAARRVDVGTTAAEPAEPASPPARSGGASAGETSARAPSAGAVPMFSGVRDSSWLGRANPLAKLTALLAVTAALVTTIDWVSSAAVILVSFILLPLAGIHPGTFLKRIWIFVAASVVAVWGVAIAGEESGRVLLDLGFTTVSEGSLQLGVAIGLRGLALVLPSVIVFSTTDPTDLADSLAQQLRLPARFVLGALAAMRLLGLLAQHWTTIGYARRASGLISRGSPLRAVRSVCSQAFGLLVQAIRLATRLSVTMEARGFGAGKRTWARPARFRRQDAVVMLGGLILAGLATAVAVAAGTWSLSWTT